MKRINNVKDFLDEVKVSFPGYQVLVNIKTLMTLAMEEIVVNDENNRRPDESKWNKDNFENFAQRMENSALNFEEYGNRENYVGLMDTITLHVYDENTITLDDGGHRFDFFTKLAEYGVEKKYSKDLKEDSFLKKIIEGCLERVYSDYVLNIFENCYIPIRFSNENKIHYIGINSTKTMNAQQKGRVAYLDNELFQYIQADAKNPMVPFVLCASGKSREETSTMDTLAFLGFLGGDSKATKTATPKYILEKYTGEEDILKFKEAYGELLKVMSNNCSDAFSFAFNGTYFKNSHMYGLLMVAREYAIERISKAYDIPKDIFRKNIVKKSDYFFDVLKTSLAVLNDKVFIDSLNTKNMKEMISKVPIDANGTANFNKGNSLFDKLYFNTSCSLKITI